MSWQPVIPWQPLTVEGAETAGDRRPTGQPWASELPPPRLARPGGAVIAG